MAESRNVNNDKTSLLASIGLKLSDWFERWFPDAFALALIAVAIVFAASLLAGSSVLDTAQRFGAGFWDLVAFTMQMSMIVVTGYAVATSPPVYAVIRRLAMLPTTGRGAAAYVGLFSMLASLVSWSFSLIFSALLAREVAHRVRGADYRAIGAAAYLGVGSVWALGLSSSAALIMAAPASLPDAIENISGVIPLSQTLGLWQSLTIAALLIVASMARIVRSIEVRSDGEFGGRSQRATRRRPERRAQPSREGAAHSFLGFRHQNSTLRRRRAQRHRPAGFGK
jgi:short-chain fatty acids transporter